MEFFLEVTFFNFQKKIWKKPISKNFQRLEVEIRKKVKMAPKRASRRLLVEVEDVPVLRELEEDETERTHIFRDIFGISESEDRVAPPETEEDQEMNQLDLNAYFRGLKNAYDYISLRRKANICEMYLDKVIRNDRALMTKEEALKDLYRFLYNLEEYSTNAAAVPVDELGPDLKPKLKNPEALRSLIEKSLLKIQAGFKKAVTQTGARSLEIDSERDQEDFVRLSSALEQIRQERIDKGDNLKRKREAEQQTRIIIGMHKDAADEVLRQGSNAKARTSTSTPIKERKSDPAVMEVIKQILESTNAAQLAREERERNERFERMRVEREDRMEREEREAAERRKEAAERALFEDRRDQRLFTMLGALLYQKPPAVDKTSQKIID